MKIANIIIAHKNPDQLLRLVRQYDKDLFHNFIHIDGRCKLQDFNKVINEPNVTLLPRRRKIVWAGFGFVRVTIEAFKVIRKATDHFFYYNIMSGMDFPIKPTREFYDLLRESYQTGCPEFFEISDLSKWPAKHRYERFHLIEWTIRGRYFVERIINWIIPKRAFYGGKFTPYGRSAWFTASEHFVDFALRFFEDNPDYLRFLKTTWNPDEFTFTTLVMNSAFKKRVAPHNLRHINWSEERVHPKTFTDEDLNELLTSEKYIARKFDEHISKTIMDLLEARIKGPMYVKTTRKL